MLASRPKERWSGGRLRRRSHTKEERRCRRNVLLASRRFMTVTRLVPTATVI